MSTRCFNVKMLGSFSHKNLVVLFLADLMAIEFLLFIVFTPSLAHGDVFASIGEVGAGLSIFGSSARQLAILKSLLVAVAGHMTDLLFIERDLVTSLKDYIRAEENKLTQIKQ